MNTFSKKIKTPSYRAVDKKTLNDLRFIELLIKLNKFVKKFNL